jgi:hypothetical protein
MQYQPPRRDAIHGLNSLAYRFRDGTEAGQMTAPMLRMTHAQHEWAVDESLIFLRDHATNRKEPIVV